MTRLIEEYLEHLRIRGCSQRTIGERDKILHRADAELPYGLTQATSDELKAWLYRDGWSRSTKKTYYNAIRGIYTFATDPTGPCLDFDPSKFLPRPSAPRGIPKPVSDAELAHILTHAAEPFLTWAHLAAYEGLRCLEIAGLHREHVTRETTSILHGKGDKPGIIPTHPAVWRIIEPLPHGPVAWTKSGLPASARYVSIQSVIYFSTKLKMPGVSMHRLRHWFGTEVYRRTKDIRRTQELLRHSSPASTAVYTLISDEERAAAIRALPSIENLQAAR